MCNVCILICCIISVMKIWVVDFLLEEGKAKRGKRKRKRKRKMLVLEINSSKLFFIFLLNANFKNLTVGLYVFVIFSILKKFKEN